MINNSFGQGNDLKNVLHHTVLISSCDTKDGVKTFKISLDG